METVSPSKRRALAPLDANAKPSSTPKHHKLERPTTFPHAPLRLFPEGRKRGLDEGGSPASAKKACVAREEMPRSRSQSPDEISMFDTSGNDASWATTATEEGERVVRPRAMTRDEAREKAEVLRLRLSLANYKMRTNQIHIPLADLQHKPIPRVRVQSPPHEETQQNPEDTEEEEDTESNDEPMVSVPRITIQHSFGEPRTTTPVSGGAATGLLHLSQDSS